MKSIVIILMTIFLFAFFSSCNQNESNVKSDIEKIKEVAAQYRNGANEGDLDLFMDAWTEDALRMEDGFNAIKGKENIREHFTTPFERFNVKVELYGDMEVEVSGNLAYSLTNYILTLEPKEGGEITKFDGKVIDVYKKQADGSWRIYIDCPTANPKWENAPAALDHLEKQDTLDPLL